MDRDRQTIQKEFNELLGPQTEETRYERGCHKLLLEVLLDIRDKLHVIQQHQGDTKWSSKL